MSTPAQRKREITPRQKATLNAIRVNIQLYQRPPTLRELAESLGMVSTNSVREHLRQLERDGYIRRNPNISRGIELIPQHPAAPAA